MSIGAEDASVGAPTQMALFERQSLTVPQQRA
jgi:hypothetical protein